MPKFLRNTSTNNRHRNLFIFITTEEAKVLSKLSSLSDVEERDHFDEENCKFDEFEKLLLAKFDISQHRPKHTGRFLTMHKRRRKRLVTRSLDQDPALLDDIFHGQVQVRLFLRVMMLN